MNAIQFNIRGSGDSSLRVSIIEVINAKIQKADSELKNFMVELQKPNQKPGRPNPEDSSWIDSQKNVFDIIESSSKLTTKLLYLRANLTDYNSPKVLYLVSSSRFKDLSLEALKEEIQ